MRATTIYAAGDVRLEEVPDPVLSTGRDAIVRVVAACVCGSDLWRYRGVTPVLPGARIGHEFVGVVEAVGHDVERVSVGDFVIAPFYDCDMTCVNCRNGVSTSCLEHSWWGSPDSAGCFADGGQGEFVRVPHADGTLVKTPEYPSNDLIPHLLTLADVFGTGHHAALAGGVGPGKTVVVIGDGAVGLCAVLASKRLGAERIVLMSRHPARQELGREFGASDIVAERGEAGIAAVSALLDSIGPDSVLECVGTAESMEQAVSTARPGGLVGFVGVPAEGNSIPVRSLFNRNVGLRGGVAPVRNYIEELLPDVWNGVVRPGRVFDLTLPLDEVAAAYAAMDERRAIKVMLTP